MLVLSIVLLILPGYIFVWLRFTDRGRRTATLATQSDFAGSVCTIVMMTAAATAGCTALSAFLYDRGVGAFAEELTSGEAVNAFYESYLWHLASVVPLLDIPKSLNWEVSHPYTDHAQGVLTVAYQLVVLIPALYLSGELLKPWIREKRDPE